MSDQRFQVGDLAQLKEGETFNHAKTGRRRWVKGGTLVLIEDVVISIGYYVRTTDRLYTAPVFHHEIEEVKRSALQLLAEQGE